MGTTSNESGFMASVMGGLNGNHTSPMPPTESTNSPPPPSSSTMSKLAAARAKAAATGKRKTMLPGALKSRVKTKEEKVRGGKF